MRKHIHRRYSFHLVTLLHQIFKVSRLSFRVAGYVNNLSRIEFYKRFQKFYITARAWRIHNYHVGGQSLVRNIDHISARVGAYKVDIFNIIELGVFAGGRVATLVMQELVFLAFHDMLHISEYIVKPIAAVLVVIGNYAIS
jgi:hypothetical protein